MKRIWRLSDAAQSEFLSRFSPKSKPHQTPHTFTLTNSPTSFRFTRAVVNDALLPPPLPSPPPHPLSSVFSLLSGRPTPHEARTREDMTRKLNRLRAQLVQTAGDELKIARFLEDEETRFLWGPDVVLEFMHSLSPWPHLALKVFDWRRNQAGSDNPVRMEEYAKAISFAGKVMNVPLAVELFDEAVNKRLKSTTIYNALMMAYVLNGDIDKCRYVFSELKREQECRSTIVTYNILISLFGRLMLVDHMERTFKELEESGFAPSSTTYNNLICGYITGWMWDKMENTFQKMKASSVRLDTKTYMLMLRGYAHANKLENMEEMYELVRYHVNESNIPLIRTMICAYCRSSVKDRLQRIHTLMKLIPKGQYTAWLHVLLIKVYAQEDRFEEMERSINEAFERETSIYNVSLMRCIAACYFRCKEVDKLAHFVKRAECARWRLCRSLYHCKMVMYGSEQRFEEMEAVIGEMACFNLDVRRKTCWILYHVYSDCGERNKVAKVIGMMWKHGYEVPLDIMPS